MLMAEAVSSRVGDSNARAQKERLDTRARKVTRQYQLRVGGPGREVWNI